MLRHGIHFISGLPRSGSTLLAALLRQNPRFHAAMTSPVGGLYAAMLSATSRKHEAAMFLDDAQRQALLRGVFENYYHRIGREQLVFDTNRMWCAKLPGLAELFPDSKMICCVRHVSWIMDSVERLARSNAFELSGMFGYDAGGTVFSRVNTLAGSEGMVGFALDALKEAFYGDQARHLLLVEYGALTARPERTLREIYEFLGEAHFSHDFENVRYDAEAFDLALGSPGLHKVARKVQATARQTILPPEIFRRFENDAFWAEPGNNVRQVRIIRAEG